MPLTLAENAGDRLTDLVEGMSGTLAAFDALIGRLRGLLHEPHDTIDPLLDLVRGC